MVGATCRKRMLIEVVYNEQISLWVIFVGLSFRCWGGGLEAEILCFASRREIDLRNPFLRLGIGER
jgi:hypothetical protein